MITEGYKMHKNVEKQGLDLPACSFGGQARKPGYNILKF